MALREVDVDLEPFTVLVGPNASGKTSILRGIQLLTNGFREKWHLNGKLVDLWDFCGPQQKSYEISLASEPGNIKIELVVEKLEPDFNFRIKQQGEEEIQYTGYSIDLSSDPTYEKSFLAFLRTALFTLQKLDTAFLRLDPSQLAAPSYSHEATPKLEPSGKGLASVLADMALSQPEEFQQIQDTLKKVVRGIFRVRIGRAQIPETGFWGHEIILDTTAAKDVPGHLTSEGTLLVLGLLTALYQKERPKVFLLDDIDRGLHPRALESLVLAIREILKLNPEMQVIATSHSPYLLDYFDAKEVRMTTTKDDGVVVCAPMTSHPDFDKWKELMKPGEFWSHVGEDWVKAYREGANV